MNDADDVELDLDWTYACDDCLAALHHKCRRRRKCGCRSCDWPSRTAKPAPPPTPVPAPPKQNKKRSQLRPGKTSDTHNYAALTDELCQQATQRMKIVHNLSEVARELNVERSNLYRGLKRRGLT